MTDLALMPVRGRVLALPGFAGLVRPRAAPRRWAPFVFLLLCAPLFAESFQYVIDCPPLYALTKAWPMLTLPLAVFAGARLALPYKGLLLTALAWTIGAAALLGVFELGNVGPGALAPTLKVWALANGLAFAGLLALIQPTPDEIARVIAVLGAITFAAMAAIWMLAPTNAYIGTIEATKVFLHDERGYRLNIPMMFGVLGIFLANRSFWRRPTVWKVVALAVAFGLLLTIYKTRVLILGAGAGVLLGAVFSAQRRKGLIFAILVSAALAGAVPLWSALHSDALAKSLGGSLSIRQIEFAKAVDFLNAEPWRWVTGVGSATRVGDVTLAEIVGTNFFFPSDLGWQGVVFEYGLIGAGLFLALHVFAIRVGWRAAQTGAIAGAVVFDYALFLLIVSPVTSVALAPGEMASCLALGWWISRRGGG